MRTKMANHALQRTAAPLGSRTVQVICSRLLQPTGRFWRRSLSCVVRCRWRAMNTSSTSETGKRHRRRWLRIFLVVIVAPVLLYVVGYFVVMDRHQPTSPLRRDAHYFDSSYRWATKQNSQKGGPPDMPWPNATGWNDLYRPLDRIYFRLFPRSDVEITRLKDMGWRP